MLTIEERAAYDEIMAQPELTDEFLDRIGATEAGASVLELMEALIPGPPLAGSQEPQEQ